MVNFASQDTALIGQFAEVEITAAYTNRCWDVRSTPFNALNGVDSASGEYRLVPNVKEAA